MKKAINMFLEHYTFSNFLKFGLFQWAVLHCLYTAVMEGILSYYGIWHPIWKISENYAVQQELCRNTIWAWVPGIIYITVCVTTIMNERRLTNKSLKEGELGKITE